METGINIMEWPSLQYCTIRGFGEGMGGRNANAAKVDLPTQEETSPFKSENEIGRKKAPSGNAPNRSAPSGSAPRPPEEDGPKCPAATGL